jgi:hypothetical protein
MTKEEEQLCDDMLLNSRKFFTCPVLHIRMKKAECVDRQHRQPTLSMGTRVRFLLYNEPADHFCRSGTCEKGKTIQAQLKGKKKP